jgi:hypothetical protein
MVLKIYKQFTILNTKLVKYSDYIVVLKKGIQ